MMYRGERAVGEDINGWAGHKIDDALAGKGSFFRIKRDFGVYFLKARKQKFSSVLPVMKFSILAKSFSLPDQNPAQIVSL